MLLGCPSGHERLAEDVSECRVGVSPADADKREQCLGLLAFTGGEIAFQPPAGVRAVEDQLGNAFRVENGISEGNRTALGDAEQREAVEPSGVDHGLEVEDGRREREVRYVPIREATAALVIANQGVVASQLLEPVVPDRALPIELEVRHPVRGFDQGLPPAMHGIGDTDTIRGRAKADLLFQGADRRPAEGCPGRYRATLLPALAEPELFGDCDQ